MNNDPHPSQLVPRLGAFVNDVIDPPPVEPGPRRRLLFVRQVIAIGGTVATLIQIIVWLLLAVFSGHLDTPWWLWTAAPAALAVGVLTVAERLDERR